MGMLNYKHFSDQVLISLLKGGDEIAYGELYRRYWSELYLYALRILRDTAEAEDAVQEVLTSLWVKRSSLEISGPPVGYLYGATRFRALAIIQRTKLFGKYVDSLTDFMEKGVYSTDERIREKEVQENLNQAITELPSKMRTIFELSRADGISQKEIAAKLNISGKTVKNQLCTALKLLKNKLKLLIVIAF